MNPLQWIITNAATLVALLWSIEKILEIVGTLTGNKQIDNIGVLLATWLKQLFPNQSPKP